MGIERWSSGGRKEKRHTVCAKAWGDENLEVFRRGVQIMVGGCFCGIIEYLERNGKEFLEEKELFTLRRLAVILQTMKKQMVSKEKRDMLGSVVAE